MDAARSERESASLRTDGAFDLYDLMRDGAAIASVAVDARVDVHLSHLALF